MRPKQTDIDIALLEERQQQYADLDETHAARLFVNQVRERFESGRAPEAELHYAERRLAEHEAHDARVDTALDRADRLADLVDELDFLAFLQEMHNATHPDAAPADSPYAPALAHVLDSIEPFTR